MMLETPWRMAVTSAVIEVAMLGALVAMSESIDSQMLVVCSSSRRAAAFSA